MAPADMEQALAAFPVGPGLTVALLGAWSKGARRFAIGPVEVDVIIGDARRTLPDWGGQADAWFLDGFAPARNPELWEAGLLADVARHTAPGGTFATYTAAGEVRRSLQSAGFQVERRQGYGRKRHMTVGRIRG
jgi:tRNA U34 5-methylaminomethyl-2-thiouridine-forming methyltransferase MnmC